jgi:hypothetical protein
MPPMIWESTDQFGTLKIGVSAAESWEDLQEDIADLIVEMRALMPQGFALHIDPEDGQIVSPDPDQPNRILQCPWAADQPDAAAQVRVAAAELLEGEMASGITLVGA